MKEQIIRLFDVLDDAEVAAKLAKTAKRLTDALVAEGFTKSEAIDLLTHMQGE